MKDYEEALSAKSAPKREIGSERTKPGTLSALVVAYYQSGEFTSLAESTQRTYRGVLDGLRERFGDNRVVTLHARHIRGILDQKSQTPAAANNLLKLLRIIMRFAVERGWRADNPTYGVRALKHRTGGHHSWTEDEIAAFEARWPIGTRERLALALLLYTAQRRSDVVRMGRQHVTGGSIRVQQQKTGSVLELPLHRSLREVLAELPADQMTFLLTSQGRPFTAAGFGNWFRETCDAAGLKGCSAHGLRKAASRRLAEAGCSPHQIMAVTGHKSLKEVVLYTAAANQRRLAEAAMDTLGDETGT